MKKLILSFILSIWFLGFVYSFENYNFVLHLYDDIEIFVEENKITLLEYDELLEELTIQDGKLYKDSKLSGSIQTGTENIVIKFIDDSNEVLFCLDSTDKYLKYVIETDIEDYVSTDIYLYKDKEEYPYKNISILDGKLKIYKYICIDGFRIAVEDSYEEAGTDVSTYNSFTKENVSVSPLNPELTKQSINIHNITLNSSTNDVLLLFPKSRISYSDKYSKFPSAKNYLVDDLDGFDYVKFGFVENKIVSILKYVSDSGYGSYNISSIVQNSYDNLVELYGLPKVGEYDFSYDDKHKYERKYTWSGYDVEIILTYKWETDKYNSFTFATCDVEYNF